MNQPPSSPTPAVWDIESSHPDLVEPIKNAMREVVDPEIGMNIIQLGLIRNVTVTDDSLVVNMIMTTPFCPYAPALLEQTRNKTESASPFPVVLALGMEPWDFSMMEDPTAFEWGLWQ
jgi:metal-sulfur cluster biosynthetic enzyme